MILRRWWRKLTAKPGPRFCERCGQALDYSVLVKRDTDTGRARRWQWCAACPESSVIFQGFGSWTGNGHARTHTLVTYAGPPVWVSVMARALTMREALRPSFLGAGYATRLRSLLSDTEASPR